MKELFIILGVILFLGGFITIICSCVVSGWKSREEEKEQHKNLDTKKLDDETYWENDLVYDDEFVKKEEIT